LTLELHLPIQQIEKYD